MTQIRIKRVYEEPNATDGYRVLVDRLWPRGIKKEHLKYDVWEKDITPSPELRKWFHEDQAEHWEGFAAMYRKELENSEAALRFIDTIKHHHTLTICFQSTDIQPCTHPATVSAGALRLITHNLYSKSKDEL